MELYDAGDIIGKTLIALQKVPVYNDPRDGAQPVRYVNPGGTVGVVYSYLEPSTSKDRSTLWWMFWDGISSPYYAPHKLGLYDPNALKQQGVLTAQEKQDANLPWYEQLIRKYGLYVLGAGVVYAGVRGYLSRPSNSK